MSPLTPDIAEGSSAHVWCSSGFASSAFAHTACVLNQPAAFTPPDVLAKQIGLNIRSARKAKKPAWSLAKLAERCTPPTSHQQISRLEAGHRSMSIEWVERIADALQVEPLSLVIADYSKPVAAPGFKLSESVANEVARVLAVVARDGEEPEPGTVQVLSLMLQELLATFSAHPQAASDPAIARPVVDLASRRSALVAS
jgi:transcriptional regulator with XRE-family HTH domain